MRHFVYGLVVGIGLTYGYLEWDSLASEAKQWFAEASSAPHASKKVDELFARER
jgi:hypothetical protein